MKHLYESPFFLAQHGFMDECKEILFDIKKKNYATMKEREKTSVALTERRLQRLDAQDEGGKKKRRLLRFVQSVVLVDGRLQRCHWMRRVREVRDGR
jgi:hypothetical protein